MTIFLIQNKHQCITHTNVSANSWTVKTSMPSCEHVKKFRWVLTGSVFVFHETHTCERQCECEIRMHLHCAVIRWPWWLLNNHHTALNCSNCLYASEKERQPNAEKCVIEMYGRREWIGVNREANQRNSGYAISKSQLRLFARNVSNSLHEYTVT